ncbi:DoxX family membrane protein [Croceiramulus getboli]|nr:DoxX family protein [Flavobacteriaceae bacterium YJPT1-3]
MKTVKKYLPLILRLAVAVILIQTLRFKLTAHPDSVYIFEQLSVEPYGRIATGILELITGILILIPRTAWLGATLALGILGGALFSHLTILGIQVPYNGSLDGGQLFFTALITFVLSAIVLYQNRRAIPFLGARFSTKVA